MHKFHFLPAKEWVAIEPRFYALLPQKCGIGNPAFAARRDRANGRG